jgi:predicted nucleic acid-binding protein
VSHGVSARHQRLQRLPHGAIPAHALSRGLTVVTDNTAEFKRVKGLKVENWRE